MKSVAGNVAGRGTVPMRAFSELLLELKRTYGENDPVVSSCVFYGR